MTKHRKGSIIGLIGLLIILVAVGFIFFSMTSDQIFFKKVSEVEKVQHVNVTLNKAAAKQIGNYTSQQISNKNSNVWRDTSTSEIKAAMGSSKLIDDDKQRYQFLDLSKYQGIDKNRIKHILFDRSTLLKHTDAFVNAAKEKHVNEVYLISHTLLETSSVKSGLANGVNIDGKKCYNFYDVGALDEDPIKTGAKYAKKRGWDTPERAIRGGTDFIHKYFLSHDDQNTLYSMRWNPMNPGEHQYTTDIKWAESNAEIIADFYKEMKTEGRYLKLYVYKDDQKHQ